MTTALEKNSAQIHFPDDTTEILSETESTTALLENEISELLLEKEILELSSEESSETSSENEILDAPPFVESDFVETVCSLCNKPFPDAKILPCAHLLCKGCLIALLAEKKILAVCPICIQSIVDRNTTHLDLSPQELADLFPSDPGMASIVKGKENLLSDISCKLCGVLETDYLCVTCRFKLCKSCSKVHENSDITNHVIKNMSDLMPEEFSVYNPLPSCSQHPGEVTDLYCSDHSRPICAKCVKSAEHTTCVEILNLQEKVTKFREKLVHLGIELTETEGILEEGIVSWDRHAKKLENSARVALAKVEIVKERVHHAMDAFSKRITDNILTLMAENQTARDSGRARLMAWHERATSHKRLVQRERNTNFYEKLDEMEKLLETRTLEMQADILLPSYFKPLNDVSVTFNQRILHRLEHQLTNLGHVSIKPVRKCQQPLFRFHKNHGDNIRLTNNQQTAERIADSERNNLVVGSEPMELNKLYEVKVEEWYSGHSKGLIALGVVGITPAKFELPSTSRGLTSSSIIAHHCGLYVNAKLVASFHLPCLESLELGSSAGVYLDKNRALHFVVDKVDHLVVIEKSAPKPCFPVIRFLRGCKKVTTLPVMDIRYVMRAQRPNEITRL